ncbi:hypothetical protein GCM10011360_14280 [Primorskyibacter flagellatus]|uniref:Periplasmic chaperone for outer membrane proteins Skp n=1 Tax=Primorskyibacter flagellatus TaxID=1387277 RepID=A0A917A6V2_9RHOB|nr:OmpH family outer membrane protein [Primorskyibacter flagellatus]GGE27067.1 hypothetical protein GCM10011360_14280 [Primorskyibacter flagellatus]
MPRSRFTGASLLVVTLALAGTLTASPALAQSAPQSGAQSGPQSDFTAVTSPILTIDSERLVTESAAGRALEQQIADLSGELAAENRRIEGELTAEEKDLTERRATLSTEDFRAAAAAFDERVQTFRTEQDAKLRRLQDRANAARREILSSVDPVLIGIMEESGAVVVLEKATVLASLQSIDITALAIERLDAAMAAGAPVPGIDTVTPDPAPDSPADDTGTPAPAQDPTPPTGSD